jgi:hypothetical protein
MLTNKLPFRATAIDLERWLRVAGSPDTMVSGDPVGSSRPVLIG